MTAFEHAEIYERLIIIRVLLFLYLRKLYNDEHDSDDDKDACQNQIWQLHRIGLHLDISFPSAFESCR